MTELLVEGLDRDGALAEALEQLQGRTRAQLLRRAVVGGGALLAAFATPATAAPGRRQDIAILNFALTLEELQSAFYAEVERNRILSGALAEQARVVAGHERAHVKAFREVLGAQAITAPMFDFGGATETPSAFRKTAVAFEDLAVAAYKGQAPRLKSRAFLASALSIHSVEARHAAWIRRLAGVSPVAGAFDEPLSKAKTERIVAATHFIASTTSRKRGPRFIG
jgi:rubrerythrin